MNFQDMFRPYSPEIRGDLEEYLREHDGSRADNLFYGPKHFFVMRDRGWMIPNVTCVRVDQSPAPDILYIINSDFELESRGRGEENMSCVGAAEGVYNPSKELKKRRWSIFGLDLNYCTSG